MFAQNIKKPVILETTPEDAKIIGDLIALWKPKFTDNPHDPDCRCDVCVYGADAAKWLNNPSEY